MIVARTSNVAAAKPLLDKGANPNVKEGQREQTPLMWAAASSQGPMVRELLVPRTARDFFFVRSELFWRDSIIGMTEAAGLGREESTARSRHSLFALMGRLLRPRSGNSPPPSLGAKIRKQPVRFRCTVCTPNGDQRRFGK